MEKVSIPNVEHQNSYSNTMINPNPRISTENNDQDLEADKRNWANLPLFALRSIAENLQNHNDNKTLHNLQSVCKNWRRSNSISTLFPCHITESNRVMYSSAVYLIHPKPSSLTTDHLPFLVSIVHLSNGKIHLCDPIFGTPIVDFPRTHFDVNRFPSTLLTESYHSLIYTGPEDDFNSFELPTSLEFATTICIVPTTTSFSLPSLKECLFLALYNDQRLEGSFSCESSYDGWKTPWLSINYENIVNRFDDILYFNGVIYVLDTDGILYEFSKRKFGLLRILADNVNMFKGSRKRLVGSNSNGKVYAIKKMKRNIEIYEFRESSRKWVEVDRFEGDVVLFVSKFYNFFIRASEIPGCNLSNCIVFSNDTFPDYVGNIGECGWSNVVGRGEVFVYKLREHNNGIQLISEYPKFLVKLWIKPNWIFEDYYRTMEKLNKQNTVMETILLR
ncbi:unnamed protein product [Amaranthus hypochondriacus]